MMFGFIQEGSSQSSLIDSQRISITAEDNSNGAHSQIQDVPLFDIGENVTRSLSIEVALFSREATSADSCGRKPAEKC